jgi:hypothetical protein
VLHRQVQVADQLVDLAVDVDQRGVNSLGWLVV